MKAAIELQTQYKLTPSKLADMAYAAGLEPADAYDSDEVELIEEAIRLDQATTSTGKPKPRKGGSIARSENSKPVRRNGEQVQHVMSTLTQKGIVQGQMAAKATMEGVAYGYTDSMEMFWDKFGQAAEMETEFTRGLAVSPDPLSVGTEEFVNSFFDGDSLSALTQEPTN